MNKYWKNLKNANAGMTLSSKIIYGIIGTLFLYGISIKIFKRPEILIGILAITISVVFHEFGHAFVAYLNGDPTAKIAGRVSLNPIKHIDILGVLVPVFLILSGAPFVIGWAKPVPTNEGLMKNIKIGTFTVALAGVFMNFLLFILCMILLKNFKMKEIAILNYFLVYMIQVNLALGIFNLIPIPPLDGSRVLEAFANRKLKIILRNMEKYGFLIIILLLWTGLLEMIITPIYIGILKLAELF